LQHPLEQPHSSFYMESDGTFCYHIDCE
jgi:hypothetical protein